VVVPRSRCRPEPEAFRRCCAQPGARGAPAQRAFTEAMAESDRGALFTIANRSMCVTRTPSRSATTTSFTLTGSSGCT
jgi:hypothetical protein